MQLTLQQAVQRDVALHEYNIALHALVRAFSSTLVRKRAERENYVENAFI
jgi:hypothetical protein